MQGYRFPNIIISIHALRGEGDFVDEFHLELNSLISIHALRGEGDNFVTKFIESLIISIHALRGEGDSH